MNKKQKKALMGLILSVVIAAVSFFSVGIIGKVNETTVLITFILLLSIIAILVFAILLIIFSASKKRKNKASAKNL